MIIRKGDPDTRRSTHECGVDPLDDAGFEPCHPVGAQNRGARDVGSGAPGREGSARKFVRRQQAKTSSAKGEPRVGAALSACYHTAPVGPQRLGRFTKTIPRNNMARSCAICGKVSMGGFNPQSSGMNRVRAHRRLQPNLQPLTTNEGGTPRKILACTRCRRTLTKSAR